MIQSNIYYDKIMLIKHLKVKIIIEKQYSDKERKKEIN